MGTTVDQFSCVANVYVKQMVFVKAGDEKEGHKHVFDHQTLLAKGSLKAEVNGQISYFTAPQIIFIKAGLEHKFTAIEDNTVAYCVHALRDGDQVEDIIDPKSIPAGVSAAKVLANAKPLTIEV
jgi:quercetin dioxygenase-like cupin family protein